MEYKKHVVTVGETWSSVALLYKISVDALTQANLHPSLFSPLVPGLALQIPSIDYFKRVTRTCGARPSRGTPLYTAVPAEQWVGFSREHDVQPVSPAVSSQAVQSATEAVAAVPAWMETAIGEINIEERSGVRANPRILEYFQASRFWGRDDSGVENAWCASFIAWVMKENGYDPVRHAFRARAWANFGTPIDAPIYGAIGVKSRRGGGHVAFVIGQDTSGEKLYMLGGNQDDKVQVSEYPRSVWTQFVVPADYDTASAELPVFISAAQAAGRED